MKGCRADKGSFDYRRFVSMLMLHPCLKDSVGWGYLRGVLW